MTSQSAIPHADPNFWDRVAPKYARKPIKDMVAYEAMLEAILKELRKSDRVLEIGCGTGGTALLIAHGVEHITATDVSSQMIRIAQAKLSRDAADNVDFYQADAAELIAPYSFDAILASSLLHLISDVPMVLDRAFAQLKPGGLLITKTVCLKHASAPIRALVPILTWLSLAPDVGMLSLSDLEKEITRAGFVIEQTRYFGQKQISPFIIARRPRARNRQETENVGSPFEPNQSWPSS